MALIKITNRYLDDLTWTNAATCDFSPGTNVDVWRINISANLSLLDSFLAIMPPSEIARADRYFQTKDKNRYIISRGALRNVLGKYLNQSSGSVEFGAGENKKPYIINSNLNYNMSHSGDWILFAISNTKIGADTELINNAFNYQEVIEDNFSVDEVNYIRESASIERFYMLWTRKEALTKATGKGLDGDLKLLPCMDGIHFARGDVISSADNWLISSFKLNEHYTASIASDESIKKMRFWDIDLQKKADGL
jgi:4'-phosphopantetheinyl transferase